MLLIAFETKENKSSETVTPAAFLVCEKLRSHLGTFMGNTGFQALVLRALALASVEIPWLRVVQVKSDGSLEGIDKLAAQVSPEEIAEDSIVLIAHLFGLLVAFIGEKLALRIVQEVWPKLSHTDLGFGRGDQK